MTLPKIFILISALFISFISCKKESNTDDKNEIPVTNAEVLADFANVLAKPNYADIKTRAGLLATAIDSLFANPNAANLNAAQQAWR